MSELYKTLEEAKENFPECKIGTAKNLTNKRFGTLTCLYRTNVKKDRPYWVYKCDCGNYGYYRASDLNDPNSHNSCPECIKISKRRNLAGMTFGKLTVLNENESRNGRMYWKCKCTCGNETWVNLSNLTSGEVQSCGCLGNKWQRDKAKNLIGKKFGKLTVQELLPIDPYKPGIYFKCTCDCNNPRPIIISNNNLISGKTKSCGCLNNQPRGYLEEMIGKKFNKLTVISQNFDFFEGKARKRWNCLCDCGGQIIVSTTDLTTGAVKSCGCLRKSLINIGETFGKLTVIEETNKRAINGAIIYKCKCECGNFCEVPSMNLKKGDWLSCGCMKNKSYGEDNIKKILLENQISFIQQKTYDNLKAEKGRKYKFDFYINNNYIIEYDGKQHFNFTDSGWDTKEHFESTRKHDLIKNKYCFDNNIPLIRIPYDVNYTIDDLKPETTRFLLTPENEKEYYNSRKAV